MAPPAEPASPSLTAAPGEPEAEVVLPAPPAGLAWEEMLDGRLRRFKRGVHYQGSGEAFARAARFAARGLARKAVTYRDQIGKNEHVWLQFMDGELENDEPCPRCGNAALEHVQKYFVRCPSCGSMYPLPEPESPPDGPAVEEVVEFLGVTVRSADGRPVEEVSVHEETQVESAWRFLRPVVSAQAYFTFQSEKRNALRSGCPDVVDVSEPQVVRFGLRVDARMLVAGEYLVLPSLEFRVHLEDSDIPEPRFYKLKPDESVPLRLFDPRAEHERRSDEDERLRLHWTVSIASEDDADPTARRPAS
jgi:hypothetical protein